MKRFISSCLTLVMLVLVWSCSTGRQVSATNPQTQASVQINLKSGEQREGIILKGDAEKLIYVDSETHGRETILFKEISSIRKISKYFDFNGDPIPVSEINSYKSSKNMLLYGAGGLILGAAAGTAVGIGLYAADQPLAANLSILLFGGLGTWYFGNKGDKEDYEQAASKARKERYEQSRELRSERRKLEEIKKEKQKLMEQLKEKREKEKSSDN